MNNHLIRTAVLRRLTFSLWAAFGLVALLPVAQAQIVAYKAAPARQQPTVLNAGNGVPLVNIQTPSAAGVSRNAYSQFDVQRQGAILNNSRTNASTQLGGWVQGNPWLAGGTARVILNEVNSSNPSLLRGYVEVAGSRAQVVIANPAGVTCDGCGFINASRATLTTGAPIVSGGNLEGYLVERGKVTVRGDGLDAGRADYADIIARAVEVNAGIWARQLQITAGANRVDAEHGAVTPVPGSGPAPAFAIDVASLGGMYADKIVLVGTEAGLGVRNAGWIGAGAGEVVVTADGRLTNSGSLVATSHVGVDAGAGIANSGTVYAQGDLTLATRGNIDNIGGLIAAGNNATLAASQISGDAASVFAAGLNADGSLAATGKLDLAASEQVTAHGQQVAGGDLAISARRLDLADSRNSAQNIALTAGAGDLDLSRATTVASGTLTAQAAQALIHDAARSSAEGDIRLIGERLQNHQGRIGAGGALRVGVGGSVDNSDALLFGTGPVRIDAASLDNRGGQIQGADDVTVQTGGAIDNRAGLIRSGKAVALTAASVDNTATLATGQGIEGQSVSLTASDIGNAGGALRATANLTLSADRSLDNAGGLLSSGDTLAIADSSAAGRSLAIANAGGTMIADKLVTIDAASLAGPGEILGLQDLDVKLTSDTAHNGSLVANRNMRFETAGILDNSGLMEAGNALTVTAGTLNNAATGTLKGNTLQLTATDVNTLTNRGLISGTDTRIDTVTLNNLGTGRIYGDTVSIAATTLTNEAEGGNAPTIAARSRLDLGITTLANRDGALIFSAGDLAIGGALDANRHATGRATSVENTGAGIESIRDLMIDATSFVNQRRTLAIAREVYQADGASSRSWTRCDNPPKCSYWTDMVETTAQYLDEVDTATSAPAAFIRAGGNATLAVGDLINRYSRIEAGGDLALTGNTLTNEGAELYRRTDVITKEHRWHYKNGLKDHGVFVYASSTSALADTVPAIISAGGLLTGSYTDRIDNVVIRQATAPTAAGSGATVPAIAVGGAGSGAGSIGRVPVGSGQSVVSANPDLSVPANSLFHQTTDPATRYLIETDPRFAGYRNWLTSDYMLAQLGLDPAQTQKRLGDGFYEQRLITEQIGQLTGRRFLTGYANDELQYQALMEAGVTFAQTWQLRPGVALSAEQMAQLTSDIVWLVEKEVAGQKVLVPQVYARLQDGDLVPSGALLAGASVDLETAGDLINSGRIAGRQVVALTAENIRNLGSSVAGKDIFAAATTDLNILGGSFTAENRLVATAGRDLTVESSTVDLAYRVPGENGRVRRTDISRVAGLYVTGANGTLLASAGRDLSLLAAAIVNANPTAAGPSGGTTILAAGNNLTLGTVTETRDAATSTKKTRWSESASSEVGSSIQTTGDLTLTAGNDLAARAATVQTGGAIDAHAGNDLTIEAGEASYASDYFRKRSSGGFLSKKRSTLHNTSESTTAIARTFSGDSVTLVANRDIQIKGSNVVATHDTTLIASRKLAIEAAAESHNETHFSKTKQSGVFSSGGVGFTLGKKQQSTDRQTDATLAAKSTVGSLEGNVLLLAGETYKQVGSDVIAVQGDIDIAAQTVDIVEARQASRSRAEQKFKQSGLTVSVSSPVITAVQTVGQMSRAASRTQDGRMQALAAASAALAAKNAYDAVQAGQAIKDGNLADQAGGVSLTVRLGSSKSKSTSAQASDTAVGSTMAAGNDVTILATGAGEQSDLTIRGSAVSAGRHVGLAAEDEIRLLAAANTGSSQSSSQSGSASIGVSVGLGTQGTGWSVIAGASRGKGNADGQDAAWINAKVSAGGTASLASGTDTTLRGAVVEGERVVAAVGGDLAIESLQDTSAYRSRERNAGFSVSIPISGAGFGGGVNTEKTKVDSIYASVNEQSGVQAGDGGFQIDVRGNTELNGAVIASTDKAIQQNLNSLTTGTLTASDIANRSVATASSSGFGIDSSMLTQGKYGIAKAVIGNALNNANESASSSGQTRSAVSEGTVTIADQQRQRELTGKTAEETVASLNRDTTNANTPVQRQDVERMRKTVEAEWAIKNEAVKQIAVLTDESYRVMFKEKPRFYKVSCPAGVDCTAHPEKAEAKPVTGTPEEIQIELAKAEAGAVLAINGILNPLERAAQLVMQNAEPVRDSSGNESKPSTLYLMHYIPANNGISEMLIGFYETKMAATFGYTNQDYAYADTLQARGEEATVSLGHSRGTAVQMNANQINAERGYTNENFFVRGVGGAVGAQEYIDAAAKVIGNEDKVKDNITYNYFPHDPVPVVAGGNPGVLSLTEFWRVMTISNSVHSCYGTGAAGCRQVEILSSNAPQGAVQDNSSLIRYKGQIQVDAQGNPVEDIRE